MIVRIWGSRGSLASGIAHTSRFGSNTSCIEVHLEEGGRIIFDAGTFDPAKMGPMLQTFYQERGKYFA